MSRCMPSNCTLAPNDKSTLEPLGKSTFDHTCTPCASGYTFLLGDRCKTKAQLIEVLLGFFYLLINVPLQVEGDNLLHNI